MKKLKYLSLIGGLLFVFASCDDNDPQSFNSADNHVSFPQRTATVDENATEPLQIPIAYACTPGSGNVTVTIKGTAEGQSNPAVEGKDYIIRNKEITFDNGSEVKHVVIEPIDNDKFEGKKTFNIVIEGTSPNLPQESAQNTVNVTIVDDEHPWAAIIGNYTITTYSVFSGNDISIPVEIVATDDDINVLAAYIWDPVPPGDYGVTIAAPVYVDIIEEDGEILVKFNDDQYIGVSPKPTNSWHPHFRATSVESDGVYYLGEALVGIFEDNAITFEYGYGIQARNPSTGVSGGLFTAYPNGIKMIKE